MIANGHQTCLCEGWWEQRGLGRQPMTELRLQFTSGQIQGTGLDVIGPFNLQGAVAENGAVTIRKQYLRRHRVDYHGTYDGEGTLSGTWLVPGDQGTWLIVIRRVESGAFVDL